MKATAKPQRRTATDRFGNSQCTRFSGFCRLQIGDTADCKSALLSLRAAVQLALRELRICMARTVAALRVSIPSFTKLCSTWSERFSAA
jgi:hypothetical protein